MIAIVGNNKKIFIFMWHNFFSWIFIFWQTANLDKPQLNGEYVDISFE